MVRELKKKTIKERKVIHSFSLSPSSLSPFSRSLSLALLPHHALFIWSQWCPYFHKAEWVHCVVSINFTIKAKRFPQSLSLWDSAQCLVSAFHDCSFWAHLRRVAYIQTRAGPIETLSLTLILKS